MKISPVFLPSVKLKISVALFFCRFNFFERELVTNTRLSSYFLPSTVSFIFKKGKRGSLSLERLVRENVVALFFRIQAKQTFYRPIFSAILPSLINFLTSSRLRRFLRATFFLV